MRIQSAFLASLVLTVPTLTFAAGFGFPREPLWVSDTSVVEGQNITMYAAVYNSSDAEMKGTVTFLADGATFDTKDVQLAAGGSSLVTDSWPAVKGSHSLSAKFESGTQKDTTGKVAVTVTAAPPVPPPTPTVVDKTVGQATGIVQNLTKPDSVVTKVADAVMGTTESIRTAGGNLVRPYASDSTKKSVASSSGFNAPAAKKDTSLIHKGTQLAAAGALFAFDTKWLFYVLLIVILFLIARAVKRWATGPRF